MTSNQQNRQNWLNPVDHSIEELEQIAIPLQTDERIGKAAQDLLWTTKELINQNLIGSEDPVSESSNANPKLGAAVARFQRARMDAAHAREQSEAA